MLVGLVGRVAGDGGEWGKKRGRAMVRGGMIRSWSEAHKTVEKRSSICTVVQRLRLVKHTVHRAVEHALK